MSVDEKGLHIIPSVLRCTL